MKFKNLLLVPFGVILIASLNSCKETKSIEKTAKVEPSGDVEIALPFSSSDYKSNSEFIREKASGKSKYDLETATQDAVLVANGKIATDLEVLIKNVSEAITNKLQINDKEEFSRELNGRLVAVTKQYLKGTKTVAEKSFKSPDGTMTYWVVRELSIKPVIEEVVTSITKNEKVNQKLKKEETTKMANDELDKMEKDQKK